MVEIVGTLSNMIVQACAPGCSILVDYTYAFDLLMVPGGYSALHYMGVHVNMWGLGLYRKIILGVCELQL